MGSPWASHFLFLSLSLFISKMEIKLPLPQFCYDQLKEESSNMYVYDHLFKSSSFPYSFPIYNLLYITDVNHLQSQNCCC